MSRSTNAFLTYPNGNAAFGDTSNNLPLALPILKDFVSNFSNKTYYRASFMFHYNVQKNRIIPEYVFK